MAKMEKRSEVLGVAIEMEKKGLEFYRKAAKTHSHPFGKKMFASLAEDERRHIAIFEEMAAKEGVRPASAEELGKESPIKRISEIFRKMAKKLQEDIKVTDDDIEVIESAKSMEEETYKFYSSSAKVTKDATERRILLMIADEENQHYRILEDTRLYLTDPAKWHLKEERPLLDGG